MRALADLLLPPRCPGCGRDGVVLCPMCARWLARRAGEPAGTPIGLVRPLPAGLLALEWCAAFSGPVRDALHALKYRGERRLVEPFAAALAERWRTAGTPVDRIAAVPVHRSRRRQRGFDQAEDLADALGAELGIPVVRALERAGRTAALHGQGRAGRAGTLEGAFRVRPRAVGAVRGRRLLLVDDIVTTGATLSGCACVLLDAGARSVAAIAVARER